MDHQWADTSYSKDKWDWFSIQLDNDTELVCCVYDDGKVKTYFADISFPDNQQAHYQDLEIIPSKECWVSPKSKAAYPLGWKIRIPALKIDLELTARIEDQEMLFGSINYFEGPLHVEGHFNRKKVKGVGFMELVGYPSQYSNVKYISDEISKTVGRFILSAKNTAHNLTNDLKKRMTE